MFKRFKTIGVLGGMGIVATAQFLNDIIDYSQEKYGASEDWDYPPVLINSLVVEGFDETGIVDEEKVKIQLLEGIKTLENAGADLIVIPCNTVHFFYEELQEKSSVPILNIIHAAVNAVERKQYKKIALFASETTRRLNLYTPALEDKSVEIMPIAEDEQNFISRVIDEAIGKGPSQETLNKFSVLCDKYKNNGADAVILGCTELPIAARQLQLNIPTVDSLKTLAAVAIDYARK